MNLLPKLESPVTRQEKMATVWDEAEVRAGRAGGFWSRGQWGEPLAGGEEVPGGQGQARSHGGGALGMWARVPIASF